MDIGKSLPAVFEVHGCQGLESGVRTAWGVRVQIFCGTFSLLSSGFRVSDLRFTDSRCRMVHGLGLSYSNLII